MIEVRDLTKEYGNRRAISNLNFTIQKGEVVGFLGPNGAGKSTTMKIITGFMAPTSGSAKVCGYDVFENPIEVKKNIGYLPETPPVYGEMYVEDYLKFVAELKGVASENLASMVDRAIEKTHLQNVRKRLIQNLSKGFRQRVGIAQAIVSNPEVLILDEPTVGLDPKQVAEIRELIKELRGQHTIILSTHILSEVEATCERIIIINQGEIVAQDSLQNLSQVRAGQQKIHIKLRRPTDSTAPMLESVPGVASVARGVNSNEWVVLGNVQPGQDGDQLVESLATTAVQNGWGLVELNTEKLHLEDVFLKLTYGAREQEVNV